MSFVAINPECQQGKHPNCDGKAMCDWPACDDIHYCQCSCHDAGALSEVIEHVE
jgi:hypothetical protein